MSSPAPRYLGQSVHRKEDRRLLTGHGQYVDDVVLPNMAHAAFVRSTIARARITAIDTAEAKALPGVYAVLTAADLNPSVTPQPYLLGAQTSVQPVFRPLADGDVRFVGDPIAIVVAIDRYVAEDAAERVVVDYEPETPVTDYRSAGAAPAVHPELGKNLAAELVTPEDPELARILASAPHVVTETLSQQRYACLPMETRGLVAHFGGPDELTVWLATQNAHLARRFIAGSVGLGDHQVRVIAKDVGGGFGLKFHLDRDEIAVVAAARRVGRPVKWIEDRTENLMVAGQNREDEVTVKLAFDDEGHILGAHFDHHDNVGAYPLVSADSSLFAAAVFPGPYRMPRYGFRTRSYFTNTPGKNAFRGPWMIESVAREWMMDIAARKLGIDSIELRRRNILQKADQPYQSPGGMVFAGVTPAETLEQALDILDLEAFRTEQAQARAQGRHIGLGISVYIEPAAMSGGVMSSEVAEIRVEPSGQVVALVSAGSAGHSIETTMAQVIADELGLGVDQVTVRLGDTSEVGFGAGAGGSRQATVIGGAVKTAADMVRTKMLAIAAHVLEADVNTLTLREGEISGPSNRWLSVKQVAEIAYFEPAKLPQGMEAGLEARHRYAPPPMTFSNATHLCVCEVDTKTGLVKVLRWIVSEDCGVMINPSVVEGQVSGGVVQGIGGVLFEHTQFDEDGNPLATSFKDYLLPLATDVPQIEFGHLCTPSDSPLGTKGVGEGGAIVAPAAVVNAVCDALAPFNVHCTSLPLSPSRLLDLLEGAKG